MASRRRIFLSLIFVLCVSGCNRSSGDNPRSESEKIQALSSQWTAAIVARDVDRILSFYSPGAVQMQGGSRAIVGRDSIRVWYQSWVTNPALSYTARTITIEVASSCDLAYERGVYQISQTTPRGVAREIGKYITIWKKLAGEWKAIIDTGTPDEMPQQ